MRIEKQLDWSISLEETHIVLLSAPLKTEKAAKNNNNSQLSSAQLRTITFLSSAESPQLEAQFIFFLSTTKVGQFRNFFYLLYFSLTENGATLTYSIDCVYLVYSDLAIVFSDLPSLDQDSKISSKKSGSGTCNHMFSRIL